MPMMSWHLCVPIKKNQSQSGTVSGLVIEPQESFVGSVYLLQLPLLSSRAFYLADNQEVDFATYAAIVEWNGAEQGVVAIASDGPPTIGMGLLYGYRLTVDVVDGGAVVIEER